MFVLILNRGLRRGEAGGVRRRRPAAADPREPGSTARMRPGPGGRTAVTVGETTAEGRHLAGSPKGYYARLARAGREAGKVMVPAADVAASELTEAEKDEPTTIVDGRWPRFVAGGPDDVRATLEQMAQESRADEIMIQDLIADPATRRRSHELLAQAFNLPRT